MISFAICRFSFLSIQAQDFIEDSLKCCSILSLTLNS